jgi:hydroxyacylglutathione hydrolase
MTDLEIVDPDAGVIIRRVVVGPLHTNCWMVASLETRRALVIDPGDEPSRLIDAASDFTVANIALTHSHWDHVLALPTVADAWGCDVRMHPDDEPVWPHELSHLSEHGHFDAGTATGELLACGCSLTPPDGAELWSGKTRALLNGTRIMVDDVKIPIIQTAGHTPGSVSLQCGSHVFTGDTLFPGGPGLTGPPLSDFPAIIESIREQLFVLPDDTKVHPGHGESTMIGAERPQLQDWIARGW